LSSSLFQLEEEITQFLDNSSRSVGTTHSTRRKERIEQSCKYQLFTIIGHEKLNLSLIKRTKIAHTTSLNKNYWFFRTFLVFLFIFKWFFRKKFPQLLYSMLQNRERDGENLTLFAVHM
jgi:hypothetical protein